MSREASRPKSIGYTTRLVPTIAGRPDVLHSALFQHDHVTLERKLAKQLERTGRRAPSTGVAIGTHYLEQRYLYAFAPQFEVQKYVRTQGIPTEVARLPEILDAWRAVQPQVQALQALEFGAADAVRIEDVPSEVHDQLTAIAADELFQSSFGTHATNFALAEIDNIVAAQRTVNLDYVNRLAEELGPAPLLADLVDFCVSPRRTSEPIQHLELADNVHAFSSPNADLRYLGGFRKEVTSDDLKYAVAGGLPAAAVIGFVGYGASSINAFLVGTRLFLNNGFHRICALRKIGVTMAPIAVQRVQNVQLEFPPAIAGIPREYLLSTSRPALVKDFFNPEFTTTVRTKARIRMIVLNMGIGAVSQHDVPA